MTHTSTATIITTAKNLHLALEATVPFALKAAHPSLQCVNIAVKDGRLQASATDRYRASTYRLHEANGEFHATTDTSISIPTHKAKEILRVAKSLKTSGSLYDAPTTALEVHPLANTFTVKLPDGTTIAGEPTPEEYPSINRLFPRGEDLDKSTNSRIVFDPMKAQEIYRTATTLAKSLDSSGVLMRLPDSPAKPVCFRLQTDEHWRALLMPLRMP